MSSLLLKALDELPISVLIATSNGILVEMNKTAIHTFKKQLMIHDDLTLKLGALEGEGKQNILIHNEGNFELGKSIYRFTSSKLTDDEGNKYLNICVFDDTISFQRLKNAEVIAKHAENAAARYCSRAESQNALQDDMNEFEVKVSLDAGYGFSVDPNATMLKLSPTGVIVECNKSLRGFEPSELIGENSYEQVHPDDIPNIAAYNIKVVADQRKTVPVYVWLRKRHKNGSYVHVEVIGAYHSDENGDRFLCCVEREIDPERMGRILSSVTDKIPCGVITIDPTTGYIEMVNPNTTDWLKMERGQEFDKALKALQNVLFSNEEFEKLMLVIKQEIDKETEKSVTVKTLEGRVLTFQCKANKTSFANRGGMVDVRADNTIIWIVNDVTVLSNAMEEKHSALIRFMRCTSHDMRTPMQAISLAAHSLCPTSNPNSDNTSSANKDDINTIISSCAVLETIMSNILEFKTIHSMKLVPILKSVEMREKVSRIVNMLQHSTLAKDGVTLSYSCEWSGNMNISVDSQMIDRIILNLVSNSLKFTQKGFVKVTCSVEPLAASPSSNDEEKGVMTQDKSEEASILRIEISDSGCGMDASSLSHVGELDFFKGEAGGFGLGTFIVRTYLEVLMGTFDVKSTVGVGTTMTIGIPCQLIRPSEPTSPLLDMQSSSLPSSSTNVIQKRSRSGNTAGSGKKEGTILVAEDVNVNRKLIVKSLEREGYTVEQAENGAVALKMMLEKRYSTVFMDIDMPIMNGDEAIREYFKQCDKELKQHPKIVILTGNITDADREMALLCGAQEFLPKPVVPKQLLESCRSQDQNQMGEAKRSK